MLSVVGKPRTDSETKYLTFQPKGEVMGIQPVSRLMAQREAYQVFRSLQPLVTALWDRWQEPMVYEKFLEYADQLQAQVQARRGQFIRSNENPFYVEYEMLGFRFKTTIAGNRYEFRIIS
jgi:hypothetical protein